VCNHNVGLTINCTGPYPTASDSPDHTPTMTSYKNRVLALSAKK